MEAPPISLQTSTHKDFWIFIFRMIRQLTMPSCASVILAHSQYEYRLSWSRPVRTTFGSALPGVRAQRPGSRREYAPCRPTVLQLKRQNQRRPNLVRRRYWGRLTIESLPSRSARKAANPAVQDCRLVVRD